MALQETVDVDFPKVSVFGSARNIKEGNAPKFSSVKKYKVFGRVWRTEWPEKGHKRQSLCPWWRERGPEGQG